MIKQRRAAKTRKIQRQRQAAWDWVQTTQYAEDCPSKRQITIRKSVTKQAKGAR